MKTQLLVFAGFLSGVYAVSAQTTLNSTYNPAPGDLYIYFNADTTGVNEGSAGTGQTWNFSSLVLTSKIDTQAYVAPSGTPKAASFPNATAAYPVQTAHYYFKGTSSDLSFQGTGSASTSMVYSDDEKLMQYPFAYPNTFTDNFAATYTVATKTTKRTGIVTVTADGQGTLVLPSGVYTNVLRVKTSEYFGDTSSIYEVLYDITGYQWFSATNKVPLLTIKKTITTNLSSSAESKYVWISSGVVGLDETEKLFATFRLSPVPAKTYIETHLGIMPGKQVDAAIFNALGAKVQSLEFTAQPSYKFDVSDLPAGIYFMRIQCDEKIATSKFVKE